MRISPNRKSSQVITNNYIVSIFCRWSSADAYKPSFKHLFFKFETFRVNTLTILNLK